MISLIGLPTHVCYVPYVVHGSSDGVSPAHDASMVGLPTYVCCVPYVVECS